MMLGRCLRCRAERQREGLRSDNGDFGVGHGFLMWFMSQIRALERQLEDCRAEITEARNQRDAAQELAQSLTGDLEDARKELESERTLRISAEAIAGERAGEVKRAYESVTRAEVARDEAVKARLSSLDLVNTTLLRVMTPEQAPTNLKDYTAAMTAMPKRASGVAASKVSDIQFVNKMMDDARKRKEEKQKAAEGTAAAS